jgi:hypothetical protein
MRCCQPHRQGRIGYTGKDLPAINAMILWYGIAMQRVIISALYLYITVIFSLIAADHVIAQKRLADFARMEECCRTAADQYKAFKSLSQSASRLDTKYQSKSLSRLDRYKAMDAWNLVLTTSVKEDLSGIWGHPGASAVERITTFLARQKITPADVALLSTAYREAGPDVDPTLTDAQERASTYLFNNLTYLSAVTGVAGSEMRELLVKQAGDQDSAEVYVALSDRPKGSVNKTAVCSAVPGADSASNLGRSVSVTTHKAGFLACVRGALWS